MKPDCRIVGTQVVDWDSFLRVAVQVLGRSPAQNSDNCLRQIAPSERMTSVLAALKNPEAEPSLDPRFWGHLVFTVLVVAGEEDLQDIVEICSEMPFTKCETMVRGVDLGVITGRFSQWQHAVVCGSQPDVELSVRMFFNNLYGQFQTHGVGQAWANLELKDAKIGFYLEQK